MLLAWEHTQAASVIIPEGRQSPPLWVGQLEDSKVTASDKSAELGSGSRLADLTQVRWTHNSLL